MKSVRLLALLFVLTSTASFAQKKLIPQEDVIVGLGYGKLLDGWGDIPGQQLFISAQAPLKQSRFFTVATRLGAIKTKNTSAYSSTLPLPLPEKNNGINLDGELAFHLKVKWFDFSPSLGTSVRYHSSRHFSNYSYNTELVGGVLIRSDHNVEYIEKQGLEIGYVAAVNLDIWIEENLIIGGRAGWMSYTHNTMMANWSVALKYRLGNGW